MLTQTQDQIYKDAYQVRDSLDGADILQLEQFRNNPDITLTPAQELQLKQVELCYENDLIAAKTAVNPD